MKAVIGVDSGGSKTRSVVVSLDGDVLGYGESGAGNPGHDDAHIENIQEAIACSLKGCVESEIVHLCAGIAGFDGDEDVEWVQQSISLAPVTGARIHLNDADIALYGALEGRPGIVSVQGAGSMIFGRIEDGSRVRNRDFRHYASAAGPWVGFRCETKLLSQGPMPGDEELLSEFLAFRGVESLEQYRIIAFESHRVGYQEFFAQVAKMAPIVTDQAANGSPTAIAICAEGARNIVDGIRIVGRMFHSPSVDVVLSGSCVRSAHMTSVVTTLLKQATEKEYRIVEPRYPPIVGAVTIALKEAGILLPEDRLKKITDQVDQFAKLRAK